MNKHEFHDIQKKLGFRVDEVAEVLGMELFTVQQWSNGTWPIPKMAEKFLKSLVEKLIHVHLSVHDDGYARGYELGYKKGYTAGHIDGHRRWL